MLLMLIDSGLLHQLNIRFTSSTSLILLRYGCVIRYAAHSPRILWNTCELLIRDNFTDPRHFIQMPKQFSKLIYNLLFVVTMSDNKAALSDTRIVLNTLRIAKIDRIGVNITHQRRKQDCSKKKQCKQCVCFLQRKRRWAVYKQLKNQNHLNAPQ